MRDRVMFALMILGNACFFAAYMIGYFKGKP